MKAKLPHASPIRMIDGLDYADNESCGSTIIVPQDSPFVNDGILCPDMLLEIMAQCFAAGCGVQDQVKNGYLAAVNNFCVFETVHAGDMLSVECKISAHIGSIWVIRGKISKQPEDLLTAKAEFKIFIEE